MKSCWQVWKVSFKLNRFLRKTDAARVTKWSNEEGQRKEGWRKGQVEKERNETKIAEKEGKEEEEEEMGDANENLEEEMKKKVL